MSGKDHNVTVSKVPLEGNGTVEKNLERCVVSFPFFLLVSLVSRFYTNRLDVPSLSRRAGRVLWSRRTCWIGSFGMAISLPAEPPRGGAHRYPIVLAGLSWELSGGTDLDDIGNAAKETASRIVQRLVEVFEFEHDPGALSSGG